MVASERFMKFESVKKEGDMLIVYNIKINPFSIDAYYEIAVSPMDDESDSEERDGVCVILKNGMSYDLLHSIDELEKMLNQ